MKIKKILAMALAAVLLVAVTVAGTVAYLTAITDEVVNTFTPAGIEVELTESDTPWSMQLIPGTSKAKDPKVTVTTSVDAYVFVKFDCNVAEGTNTLTYDFALDNANSGWTQGNAENGVPTNVWYKVVNASETPYEYELLVGNVVSVPAGAVGTDVATGFTMTFDAWAVQYANGNESNFTPAQAWAQVPAQVPAQ